MSATPQSWLLLAILLGFFLHVLWRLIDSRNASAIACFVAGYFLLAASFRLGEPSLLLSPVLLPFVYGYAWLGLSALLWSAANMKVSRRGLSFPSAPPALAALMAAQLPLHVGVLAFSPWMGWRPLATYVMLPPLVAAISYGAYRLTLPQLRRNAEPTLRWTWFGALSVLLPLVLTFGGQWLAARLLGVL